MYKTSFRLSLFVIILMLPWAAIYAAGLGKLTLNSALGQPLNAEIEIVSATRDEAQSLRASVASRDAYGNAGISYESILSSIKASVETRSSGTPYIKLTSAQAINDPFLMVLMELSWSSGRILREYTVLLDPVEIGSQQIASANTFQQAERIESPLDIETVPAANAGQTKKSSSKPSRTVSRESKNTYGPVNRGDTLSSIARQVMPSGVNLNQMLVALHRANRDAFISNNMNLLKVGAVLAIPEKSEIAAIDASTANNVIKAQVDDWRNYQNKLSKLSREAPTSKPISQSDQGQIITHVEKKAPIPSDAPKEVLKLSSGAQLPETNSESTDSGLVDRLRMMEEDAIARNLALKEANERVAMLEKSVQNLKHLLELKDSVLAQAQLNAESQGKLDEQLAAIAPDTVVPEANNDLSAENEVTQEIEHYEEIPSAPATIEPAKSIVPVSPPEEESSLTDLLMENIEYIGLASLLFLLLALLIIRRRKAKAESESDDDSERESLSSAFRSRLAGIASARAASTAASDHTSSESEINESEDEEMKSSLKSEDQYDSFDKEAGYYDANAEFNEVSDTASESEFAEDHSESSDYTFDRDLTETSGDETVQSAESNEGGDSSISTTPIDFDFAEKSDAVEDELSSKRTSAGQSDEETAAADDSKDSGTQAHELEMDFAFDEPSREAKAGVDTVSEENEGGIDFDLSNSSINLTEDSDSDNQLPDLEEKISLADDADNETAVDNTLDFQLPDDDAIEATKTETEAKLPELGLAEINLDLEEPSQPVQSVNKTEEIENDEQWQEVETKLDLAKAYLEMEDKEGAKEMLEEVLKDGNDKQKKAAKKMLKGL